MNLLRLLKSMNLDIRNKKGVTLPFLGKMENLSGKFGSDIFSNNPQDQKKDIIYLRAK